MLARSIALIAVLSTGSPAGPASYYIPYEPHELVLQADLIVEGVVVSAQSASSVALVPPAARTFTLRVDRVLGGETELERLEVRQFEDWMCASRHAPYEKGQEAVFFLQRRKDGALHVMGAGNEGECPIDGDRVLHQGYGWSAEWKDLRVNGRDYRGVEAHRDQFAAAIRGLRRCYVWESCLNKKGVRRFPRKRLRQVGSDEAVEQLRHSSTTSETLVSLVASVKRE